MSFLTTLLWNWFSWMSNRLLSSNQNLSNQLFTLVKLALVFGIWEPNRWWCSWNCLVKKSEDKAISSLKHHIYWQTMISWLEEHWFKALIKTRLNRRYFLINFYFIGQYQVDKGNTRVLTVGSREAELPRSPINSLKVFMDNCRFYKGNTIRTMIV